MLFKYDIFNHSTNCFFEVMAKNAGLHGKELAKEYKERAGDAENLAILADILNEKNKHGEEYHEFAFEIKDFKVLFSTYLDRDGGVFRLYSYDAILNELDMKEEGREFDENGEILENQYFIRYAQTQKNYLKNEDFEAQPLTA